MYHINLAFSLGKAGSKHKAKNTGKNTEKSNTSRESTPSAAKKAKPSSQPSVQSLPSPAQPGPSSTAQPEPSTSNTNTLDSYKIPRRKNPFSTPTIPADLGMREFKNSKFLCRIPNYSFNSRDFLPPDLYRVDSLCNKFESLIVNSVTASTWHKHKSAWSLFSRFCTTHNCAESWPVNVKTIRAFAVWALTDGNLKHSTVKSYISSMDTGHVIRGMNSPKFLQDSIVNMILKGAENFPSADTHYKFSVNPAMLATLGHYIAISTWTEYSKQLFWSLFLLAFYTSCRMGELVSVAELTFDSTCTLLWSHIHFLSDNHGATIHLTYTKTKRFAGETVEIFSFGLSNFCPVLNLLKLKHMQKDMGFYRPDFPVFRFSSGRFVTGRKVNQILKAFTNTMYKDLDLNITGHSFRSSIPTILATLPVNSRSLSAKEWGRWSSDSYKLYVKNSREEKKELFKILVPVLYEYWK